MNGSTGKCTKEWVNEWMRDCANDNFMDDWLKNSHCMKNIQLETWKRHAFFDCPMLYGSLEAKKKCIIPSSG